MYILEGAWSNISEGACLVVIVTYGYIINSSGVRVIEYIVRFGKR